MQDLDHKHILIKALFVTAPNNTDALEDWLRDLVVAIDMKILMEPQVFYCDTPGNEGVTGGVIIETSHCTFHIWEDRNVPYMNFDLYSCKRFDPNIVLQFISKLGAVSAQWKLIDRNDGIKEVAQGQENFIPPISLLDERSRQLVNQAQPKKYNEMSVEEKTARSLYNSICNKYSFSARQTYDRRYSSFVSQLSSIKTRCDKKSLDFDLTPEWMAEQFEIAQQKWPQLNRVAAPDSFWFANVDRKDSTQGYTKNNCHIIPRALNVAKWNWTNKELLQLQQILTEYINEN